VLGHEIGHVAGRHGAEQLAQQKLTAGLVGAAGVASYDPDDPYRSQRRMAMAAAVGQLVNLRYSRNDELEADALGVRFQKESHYDPRGMIELMQVLEKSGGGGRTPEFFATHPNPGNRLAQLRQLVDENGGAGGDRNEAAFKANVLDPLRGVGGSGAP
jgi:beta-barrel assembly-enhancing protease